MRMQSLLPLWYVAGAGGSWLNYLTWCSIHQDTIEAPLPHFRRAIIKKFCNNYDECYYRVLPHSTKMRNRSHDIIILGSNRAWINFWILVSQKHDPELDPDWTPSSSQQFYRPTSQIQFNLDWCDIFENPRQFINNLKRLSGLEITYDQYTQRAIEQYRASCTHLDSTRSELMQTDLVQDYIKQNNITVDQAQELLWTEK